MREIGSLHNSFRSVNWGPHLLGVRLEGPGGRVGSWRRGLMLKDNRAGMGKGDRVSPWPRENTFSQTRGSKV